MNTPTTKAFLTGAIKSALLGVAVGDALGVPAEFRPREFLRENPVTDMTGHGTHYQPPAPSPTTAPSPSVWRRR